MIRILFIVIVFSVVGCSKEEGLPAGKRGESFRLADASKQESALKEIRARNIPFFIDDEGFVNYLLINQAEIKGIKRTVLYGEDLNPNHFETIILVNEYVQKRYEETFKTNSIPYTITEKNGVTSIEFSQVYAHKVDIIQQQLEVEIMDYYSGKQ